MEGELGHTTLSNHFAKDMTPRDTINECINSNCSERGSHKSQSELQEVSFLVILEMWSMLNKKKIRFSLLVALK